MHMIDRGRQNTRGSQRISAHPEQMAWVEVRSDNWSHSIAQAEQRLGGALDIVEDRGLGDLDLDAGRLDSGVLLLAKPYRKSDMAKMVRKALDS